VNEREGGSRPAIDRVSLLGSLLGLASLGFAWFKLSPNRLAQGSLFYTWQSAGALWIVIALLWLACLGLSLTRAGFSPVARGTIANLILIAVTLAAGPAATHLLSGQPDIARVSLSAGFWLSLVAASVVIFGARQRMSSSWLKQLVTWSGFLVMLVLIADGWLRNLSLAQEFAANAARFWQELGHHLLLVFVSVTAGSLLGMLLGLWAYRSRSAEKPIVWVASITQTIPSLALFGILIAPLSALSFAFPALRNLGIRGVGNAPALIALVLYSLLPVVRNTLAGLRHVDPAAIEAGRGMGMGRSQLFRRVEAPLAAPIVLEGVRTAAVQNVGLTAVAALIGAGGLGWFIFAGIGQAAGDLILLGAIPIVALAVVVDALMRGAVALATPRGNARSS
jgi:osmoprotectant transport system permease protein